MEFEQAPNQQAQENDNLDDKTQQNPENPNSDQQNNIIENSQSLNNTQNDQENNTSELENIEEENKHDGPSANSSPFKFENPPYHSNTNEAPSAQQIETEQNDNSTEQPKTENSQENIDDDEIGQVSNESHELRLQNQGNKSVPVFNQNPELPRSSSTKVQIDINEFDRQREMDVIASDESLVINQEINVESTPRFNQSLIDANDANENIDEAPNSLLASENINETPIPLSPTGAARKQQQIDIELLQKEEEENKIEDKNQNQVQNENEVNQENQSNSENPNQNSPKSPKLLKNTPNQTKKSPNQAKNSPKSSTNSENKETPSPRKTRSPRFATSSLSPSKQVTCPNRLFLLSLKPKYSDDEETEQSHHSPPKNKKITPNITTSESIKATILRKKQRILEEKEKEMKQIMDQKHKISKRDLKMADKASKRPMSALNKMKLNNETEEEEVKESFKYSNKLPSYLDKYYKFTDRQKGKKKKEKRKED
ncbi:hypothetical protein TRFO_37659 [Tritrichomonas foetus]|uniref:Uncharacterized protein n=1 Tax=Tritrichomonas foetus TaxID=1144522 RepID=A0A1J4JFI3_9EUKA|nr:hypothetical protein TRFO_37659 [Tritrichomonas foetus]|eukprot:OHS96221.1 hypothetical protein TRFO_37659 [Tritrichomonas foetus]